MTFFSRVYFHVLFGTMYVTATRCLLPGTWYLVCGFRIEYVCMYVVLERCFLFPPEDVKTSLCDSNRSGQSLRWLNVPEKPQQKQEYENSVLLLFVTYVPL